MACLISHRISETLAAVIIQPPHFDATKQYPAVICVHPIGSCKEQTSGAVYGKAIAQAGFVAIAFDASFQGESGGVPRFLEDASQRVEDIRRVVDFLVTLPYIKVDSIGVLGICGGGGYALNATMTEKRIKAVVSITGVNFGRLMREGFSLYDALGSLEAMAKQRTAEATGVPVKVNAVLPTSVADAAKQGLTDRDIVQATDYYRARAPHPSGATSMVYSHLSNAVSWDAFNFCETLLNQPILVVTGDQVGSFGAYRDGLEIYGRAVLSKERELAVLEGVSHYELYDQPEPVKKALDKVIPFFSKYLV